MGSKPSYQYVLVWVLDRGKQGKSSWGLFNVPQEPVAYTMIAKAEIKRLQKYKPWCFLNLKSVMNMSSIALYHAMAVKAVMARMIVWLLPVYPPVMPLEGGTYVPFVVPIRSPHDDN